MVALFDNQSLIHHYNFIGIDNRRQAMRNDNRSPAFGYFLGRTLNQFFRLSIN